MSLIRLPDSDPAMAFAIAEAQRTLPQFFEQLASPRPSQEYFLVEVCFEQDGQSEHIWMANVDASVFPPTGTVANEPTLPGLKFMDQASFYPEQISDWMIIESGIMVGGYTNQVAISRMTELERAQHLAELPYKVPGYS
jgi:uncharacterized protein YegJ (DUF2314 family)